MGDHRASVKIEMHFHGITEKADMWINWSPEDSECSGVDQRVINWFRSMTDKGMTKYHDDLWEYQREAREKEERKRELAELSRLKKKYE